MIKVRSYAVQSATSPLALHEIERREVMAKDVQFDILYCWVCHSDIHSARDEWWGGVYPMVPWHELVGRVTKVWSQVTKFKEWDLVWVGCLVDSCKHCENCDKWLEQYCLKWFTWTYNGVDKISWWVTYGGYSKQIVVKEEFVLKVSEKLPLEWVAPLLCAGITTYSPLRHWKIGKWHKVAVVWLWGLWHMAVKFAASFGAEVTMLSTSPQKEQDARHLWAHHFALTKDPDQIKDLQGTFDFIVDTVSAPHDYNMYLQMLKTDWVLICLGAPPTPAQIAVFSLIFGRRQIAGSLIWWIAETQEMLDYCAEHNIVSDIELIRMDYINEAYERMIKWDVKYRFVIDMNTL